MVALLCIKSNLFRSTGSAGIAANGSAVRRPPSDIFHVVASSSFTAKDSGSFDFAHDSVAKGQCWQCCEDGYACSSMRDAATKEGTAAPDDRSRAVLT